MSQDWEVPLLRESSQQRQNSDGNNEEQEENYATSDLVISRIEQLAADIIAMLDEESLPILETYQSTCSTKNVTKRFNMSQCRSFASILLVLSFCHSLLQAGRTTTTREVYYFYVTHFRSQKECDAAIWDAATLLQVPRHALGLTASPRGWYCGDIQLIDLDDDNNNVILDGRSLQTVQGAPISSEWLTASHNFVVHTQQARCILVVEKEGVYNRLSEDRFFDHYPCILVTGKGFPDLATRALVHHLHQQLDLPVRGLADCDPFGVMVLHTYQQGSTSRGVDGGNRYSVPMEWVGLRPSQVERLVQTSSDDDEPSETLPDEVFQRLTVLDQKRLEEHMLKEDGHRWTNFGENMRRVEELEDMRRYKVELEALNWLGMDFCAQWVSEILHYHDAQVAAESSHQHKVDHDEEPKEWLEII